ncbi:IucA/IucC family protein [Macrococcus animalis]|uniref:IucA/IucC family protein n=1 Tax=Macrococcus animalis TaxID=3395467 RepID=UPI0039BE2F2D
METIQQVALHQYTQIDEKTFNNFYAQANDEINARLFKCKEVEAIETNCFAEIEQEIGQSIDNLTLSLIQFDQDQQQYAGRFKNMFEFVNHYELKDTMFEQCVTMGHPFHPMTKTKLGLSPDEVLQYAPEFRKTVKIIPVVCEAESTYHVGTAQIPKVYRAQLYELAAHHGIKSPAIIFVHEWQYNHYIKSQHQSLLDNQICVPIEDMAVDAHPLLSFRTLYVPSFQCIVKTAVNAQATSAIRNVSQASIHNGVSLGAYVSQIYQQYDGCFIQQDISGTALNIKPHDNKISSMLRASIPYTSNQDVLVCASLISKSFITGQAIVMEGIDMIAEKNDITQKEAIVLFFEAYTNLLIRATYRLMLAQDISLEAHMQNSSIILEEGMSVAIYMRDFGGVRLTNQSIDIDESTGLYTQSFDDLLSVFSHAVLYNHLFQLVGVLSKDIDEQSLYTIIYNAIDNENQHFHPPINVLELPYLKIKSLLKMRLYGDSYDYKYSKIKNPLRNGVLQCWKK